MSGYIYIRNNEDYKRYNIVKVGKTLDLNNRHSTYVTCEVIAGWYELIIEMDANRVNNIEKLIFQYFDNYHFKLSGGSEFFKIEIKDEIIDMLSKTNLVFKVLNTSDINVYYKAYITPTVEYNPRDYQIDIINKSLDFFTHNPLNLGILNLPCGVGKTLISLWIALKLLCTNILICAPNKIIGDQWKKCVLTLFPNKALLIINGLTLNKHILKFFEKNSSNFVIIATYYSSLKLNNLNLVFDINIIDEFHHLCSNSKKYKEILNINSNKQLGLSATLLNKNYDDNIIYTRNIKWAIENNIICDYQIKCYNIKNNNIFNRLYISAYLSLFNILNSNTHHIIIYTNTIDECLNIIKYIDILKTTFIIENLYYSEFCKSNINKNHIINSFTYSKYGILVSVYSLGEGVDLPIVDAVMFSNKMYSNIRIIQSALRASRKNKNEINKITKIIIPILYQDNISNILNCIKEQDEDLDQKVEYINIIIDDNNDINIYDDIDNNINETYDFINTPDIKNSNTNYLKRKHYNITKHPNFIYLCNYLKLYQCVKYNTDSNEIYLLSKELLLNVLNLKLEDINVKILTKKYVEEASDWCKINFYKIIKILKLNNVNIDILNTYDGIEIFINYILFFYGIIFENNKLIFFNNDLHEMIYKFNDTNTQNLNIYPLIIELLKDNSKLNNNYINVIEYYNKKKIYKSEYNENKMIEILFEIIKRLGFNNFLDRNTIIPKKNLLNCCDFAVKYFDEIKILYRLQTKSSNTLKTDNNKFIYKNISTYITSILTPFCLALKKVNETNPREKGTSKQLFIYDMKLINI